MKLLPLTSRERCWPSGDCIDLALIDVPERLLESALGVPFERGLESGLGEWVAAGGRLPGGTVVELIRYEQAPAPGGFTLRVDAGADLRSALDELLVVAGLRRDTLRWVSPRLNGVSPPTADT